MCFGLTAVIIYDARMSGVWDIVCVLIFKSIIFVCEHAEHVNCKVGCKFICLHKLDG